MRIIDYYNLAASLLLILITVCTLLNLPVSIPVFSEKKFTLNEKQYKALFFLFLAAAAFLRFYRLATLPEGFHQDEVSNSYEAFSLGNFGVDRNGYRYPVYPITWGSGGGNPILIYFYSFLCKVIEPSVFSYRAIFAASGVLTIMMFYLFLKKTADEKTALLGMGILTVTPWHIFISRWGLDSNTIPFWCMIILLLFLRANKTKETRDYLLAAVFCAVILYSYGSATFVIPFFLLFACGYSMWTGTLKVKQLIYSGLAFLLAAFPLAVFYFINVFDLAAIETAYFSFPKFTGVHTGTVFLSFDRYFLLNLGKNFVKLIQMFTIGTEDELWNYLPGYFTLYHFTFPFTFLGLYAGGKELIHSIKTKMYHHHGLMMSMFLGAFLIGLTMKPNINRTIFLYLPLVYFMTVGFAWVRDHSKVMFLTAGLILSLGACSFVKDYFTEYGPMTSYLFMKGYGEAVAYAESIREDDQQIYSTYENLASPFITALLYSRTSPFDYLNTVTFKDEGAEFRVATGFTHYTFGLPEDITEEKYKEHLIIIENKERERFEDLGYEMVGFGNYAVLHFPN